MKKKPICIRVTENIRNATCIIWIILMNAVAITVPKSKERPTSFRLVALIKIQDLQL